MVSSPFSSTVLLVRWENSIPSAWHRFSIPLQHGRTDNIAAVIVHAIQSIVCGSRIVRTAGIQANLAEIISCHFFSSFLNLKAANYLFAALLHILCITILYIILAQIITLYPNLFLINSHYFSFQQDNSIKKINSQIIF